MGSGSACGSILITRSGSWSDPQRSNRWPFVPACTTSDWTDPAITAVRTEPKSHATPAFWQPRAFRQALSATRAAEELEAEARAGRLDADAVHRVLTAAGQRPHRTTAWPAALSDREVEVLRLLCRGGTNKQVALLLEISPKTVGHHVSHIYDKIGVSTRAGATLFAVEQDLLQ